MAPEVSVRLGAVAIDRCNNITALRLAAATLVVLSHSYRLAAGTADPLMTWTAKATFGSVGVWIFFLLSGFLISASLDRGHGVWAYAEARVLRIVPALALVLIAAAFVLGPLVTTQPLWTYFSGPEVWQYVWRNLLFDTQYLLPGVFEDNPYPATVNGSLWTLRIEVYMYIILGALYWLRIGSQRDRFNTLMVLVLPLLLVAPLANSLSAAGWDRSAQLAVVCFALGALFYHNRDRIPLSLLILLGLIPLCWLARRSPSRRARRL